MPTAPEFLTWNYSISFPRRSQSGVVRLLIASAEGVHPDELFAEVNYLTGDAAIALNPFCNCPQSEQETSRISVSHDEDASRLVLSIAPTSYDSLWGSFALKSSPSGEVSIDGPLEETPFIEVWQYRKKDVVCVYAHQ